MPNNATFCAEGELEISHKALCVEELVHALALCRLGPDVKIVNGAADEFLTWIAKQLDEAVVGIEDCARSLNREAHCRGAVTKDGCEAGFGLAQGTLGLAAFRNIA